MLKLYWTLWAVIAFTALLFLATGTFTVMTLIAYGFVSFGMIFMGMIALLPMMAHHTPPAKAPKAKPVEIKDEREDRIFHANHLATR